MLQDPYQIKDSLYNYKLEWFIGVLLQEKVIKGEFMATSILLNYGCDHI